MELEFPPGVVKTQSESAAIGRFVDCDWVRWIGGKPEKIGGYVRMTTERMRGFVRGMHAYLGQDGFPRLGAGSNVKLYQVRETFEIDDITPLRRTVTLNAPLKTTAGSSTVTVTHTAHGADVGDTVIVSAAAAVGGLTIAGPYLIATTTADAFTITAAGPAASTATGGGATVKLEYEINVGPGDGTKSAGYGAGDFGEEAYGTERSKASLTLLPRFWALDNYGRILIGAYNRSYVYIYDDLADDRAKVLENSPADCLFVFVTEERFIVALRDGMVIAWPDQTDPTQWEALATNTANRRRLAAGSTLVGGASLTQGTFLIWTDTSAYLGQYTGGEFVYDTRAVGHQCGLVGPNAFCIVDGIAFWMSAYGFHYFSGFVDRIRNSEDVQSWLFAEGHINKDQQSKAVCFYNHVYREVWFIYPAEGSSEPNRYAMVSLIDFSWAVGTLSRIGHANPMEGTSWPLMSDVEGYIYRHETGKDGNNDAIASYLTTGMIRTDNAGRIIDITGFAPDFDRLEGRMSFTVTARDRPMSRVVDEQTVVFDADSEMEDLRVSGRFVEFHFRSEEIGGDFRFGVPIIETGSGGARR